MKSKIKGILVVLILSVNTGCGFYSFTGSSIPLEVETFSVAFFENNASIVAPSLSQIFTEKLKDKFVSETNLDIVETSGDYDFSGYISNYTVEPISAGSSDNADQNRLTITVFVKLVCEKDKSLSFETSFDAFENFDASINFASVEDQIIDNITELLIQKVFNRAANNW